MVGSLFKLTESLGLAVSSVHLYHELSWDLSAVGGSVPGSAAGTSQSLQDSDLSDAPGPCGSF